jgi:uncharacterized membrane protein HdeD (DUF308 family)
MLMALLVRNWWLVAIRGVLAMLLGLTILVWSDVTMDWLVILFGSYALLDGACALLSVVKAAHRRPEAWPVALAGLVSLGLGVLAFSAPLAAARFVNLIAGWGLITGVLEIAGALRLPRQSAAHWFLITGGVSSLFLALFLALLPHAVSEQVARAIGLCALVFGIAFALAAWVFRRSAGGTAASPPRSARAR